MTVICCTYMKLFLALCAEVFLEQLVFYESVALLLCHLSGERSAGEILAHLNGCLYIKLFVSMFYIDCDTGKNENGNPLK